jgi:mannosyltransferase OCH1-like enzyme
MNLIPKIIHQIWFQGYNNIDEKNKNNTDTIKKYHQDWDYMFWDENKILDLLSRDKIILDKYNSYIYLHQKVDFAKIVILKYYGGAYIDIDVIAIKSINEILDNNKEYDFIVSYLNHITVIDKYLSCQDMRGCINNGIIISKKNSDICDYLIENFENKCYDFTPKLLCIQNTTGPNIFTKLLYNYKGDSKILILPHQHFEPCIFGKNCDIKEDTYLIHEHNLSWIDDNIKIIAMIYSYKYLYIYVLVFIFILYLIYKRK